MHKPIIHIYQDGDRFFAALPDFVDLQESGVIWIDVESVHKIRMMLQHVNQGIDTGVAALYFRSELTDTEKDDILHRAGAETINPHAYRGG